MPNAAIPAAFNTQDPTTVDAFQSLTGWSTAGSSGEFSLSLVPIASRSGAFAMRWANRTANGVTVAAKTLTPTQDLSAATYIDVLVYYPNPPVGGGGGQTFTLYLDSTGGNFSNYFLATCAGSLTGTQKRGWNTYRILKSAFTVGGGSPVWTAITQLQIRFQPAAAPDEFWIAGVFASYRSRAKVLLTLDDGPISQNAAVQEANALGLKVTINIVPQLVINGGGSSYLSVAQLQALLAAGNPIQTHGWDHTSFINYTDGGLADMVRQREWMIANGLGPGSNPGFYHHAWVQGDQNEATRRVLRGLGVLSSRGVRGTAYAAGPPERFEMTANWDQENTSLGLMDAYGINAPLLINSSYTDVTALAAVDKAIQHGNTIAFYAHVISASAGDFSAASWTALVNGIATRVRRGLIDCVTQPQWHETLHSRRARAA